MKKIAALVIPPDNIIDKPFYFKQIIAEESDKNDSTKGHQVLFLEFATLIGIKTDLENVYNDLLVFGCIPIIIQGEHNIISGWFPEREITPTQRKIVHRLRKYFARFEMLEFSSIEDDGFFVSSLGNHKDDILNEFYEKLDKYYANKRQKNSMTQT